jgi:hypothetical protein
MGYSSFKKIKTVVKKFNLDVEMVNLFEDTPRVEPSAWLRESLRRADLTPQTNEKTKAERIISPILLEVAVAFSANISFFSGEAIDVRPEDDLSGECDFVFTLQARKPYIEAPIISLAEAKDEDMEWGIAQCAAQMYGAHLYNEAEGKNIPVIYGCATDGIEWRFLKLEKQLYSLDTKVFTEISEILGVWHRIITSYLV